MASDMVRNGRRIAIGLGLAGGAVFGLASSTAQLGDNVAKTADRLAIGVEELQELRYAAERSGVATSAFDSSLEKMTKNIGLAMEGTGAQKDALDALGLSASDLATMLPEEALGLIADRMNGVATQAEKAAIANDIFGRSGIGMLNMLRDGSSGFRDLRDDARRTGYVLSEQAARDAEVFQDTLLDTQLVMKGLKNTVGAELVPVVTQAMRRVGDTLIENREQVKVWATSFASGVDRVLPIIGEVAIGIGRVLSITGEVISTTAEMVGGWENFGIIIGGVLASRTVLRIAKFGKSVFSLGVAMTSLVSSTPLVAGGIKAIGAALVANPIGAAITVIAGGAALIYANWETVGPWFKNMWIGIKGYFSDAASVVEGVLVGLGGVFDSVWNNTVEPIIVGLSSTADIGVAWEAVKAALDPVLTWIAEKFSAVMAFSQPVIDALQWGLENAQAAGNAIGSALGKSVTPYVDAGALSGVRGVGSGASLPAMTSEQASRLYGIGPGSQLQTNALGGAFHPGWHLTGEKGPELKFENRSGYVANNRAMRQLANYADRVGSVMPQARTAGPSLSRAQRSLRSHRAGPQGATRTLSAMSARIDAALGGGSPQQAAAAASREVTQNITNHFHASGVSADELMSIAERKRRTQAQGALFDRAPASGPFGR